MTEIVSLNRRFSTTLPAARVTVEEVPRPLGTFGPLMEIRAEALNHDDAAWLLDRLADECLRMAKTLRDHQ